MHVHEKCERYSDHGDGHVRYKKTSNKNAFQYRPLRWPPLDVSTGDVTFGGV